MQKALDNVSFNLRDSEFVAILGPSGSGKTTLLNIIGGLDRYDSGDLVINGISTKEYNDRDWDTYRNHSIGFVFQSYNLISHQSILANVELALTIAGLSARERKERAKNALVQVGLADHINKKPNQLSGGQMQRVALARALVNDPDILLADEPTGALDTETSIQVMDLMKEVAKDRLVVMVTHNPELAEEYASRIIRLRDGKITDDTMPCSDAELFGAVPYGAEDSVGAAAISAGGAATHTATAVDEGLQPQITNQAKQGKTKKKRKASMSFLTSLGLSFSNLKTKKGRTILTSFAGSIGIIGIALILSLSTGVNDYIDKIQRDTMASYPITISATSLDLSSFMGNGEGIDEEFEEAQKENGEEEETEPTGVPANYFDIEASSAVTTSIKENNLTDFKKYLDDKNSEIHQYVGENGIVYTYDVDFKVYSYDKNHKLVDTDLDVTSEFSDDDNVLGNLMQARSLMLSNASAMFGGGSNQNAANFSEMMAGANGDTVSALIKDNYDVVYGNWPDSYDEAVIVLNQSGSLFSGTLYQLGLISKAEYEDAVHKVEKDEEPTPIELNYKEICDHTFYLVLASDRYEKTASGTFSYTGDDEEKLEEQMKNAVPIKIVGLVKASEDSDIRSLETTVCYTTKLTDYIVERGNNSDVITAQKNNPDTDVLTGQAFMEEEPDEAYKAVKARAYLNGLSHDDKANAFSTLMIADYEGAMRALMTTQMSAVSEQVGAALQQTLAPAIQQAVQSIMTQAMSQMQQQMQAIISKAMEQAMRSAMQQMVEQVVPQVMAKASTQLQEEVVPQLMQNVVPQVVEQMVFLGMQNALQQITEQLGGELPAILKPLAEATTVAELQEALSNINPAEIAALGIDFSALDFSQVDMSQIDYSKIDFSGVDLSGLDLSDIDLSQIDFSKVDVSGLDFSSLDLSSLDFSSMDMSNLDLSGMGAAMENISLSDEEGDTAETVQFWLDNIATQKSLAKVFDQMIGVSSYDGNLTKFGYVSYDAPTMISLYADSFEGKDGIAASIQAYNERVEEENKITYTDYVALLTSSITTIINAISYVLIGFVGVSLFVSCIMIGIITNISVLERTKEIGVLRALGASKRNISNVFNAETFIIGCLSGILGVGVSLLLILPINAIVHSLMDSTVLSAKLPPVSAIILIVISIVITMIGGLIPAKKASRQDPVVALRTE